jgi:hypothetical protein
MRQLVVWPFFTQILIWHFLSHTNAALWAPVPIPAEIKGHFIQRNNLWYPKVKRNLHITEQVVCML